MNSQRHDAAEVTEADREAAASVLYCDSEAAGFDAEGRFKLDMDKVAAAFARHRQASEARLIAKLQSPEARERVAVVSWLREQKEHVAQGIRDKHNGPDSSVWWALGFAADAIEKGEHNVSA